MSWQMGVISQFLTLLLHGFIKNKWNGGRKIAQKKVYDEEFKIQAVKEAYAGQCNDPYRGSAETQTAEQGADKGLFCN